MPIKESHADTTDHVAARPGLGQIADVFIRYGNFTLGGGSAKAHSPNHDRHPAAFPRHRPVRRLPVVPVEQLKHVCPDE
jgi:hypothetical protein